jgi:hypothetical protein
VAGGRRGDATVAHDASVDRSIDAADASCDPGVPGVKCLARVPSGNEIFSLVVDDTRVYFVSFPPYSDAGGQYPLFAASRATGEVVTLAAFFPAYPDTLLKDDAALYGAMSSGIGRVPLDGGAVEVLAMTDAAGPECIAYDSEFLYATGAFGLDRLPKAGGAASTLVPHEDIAPEPVVVQDGRVYFGTHFIDSVAADGGGERAIASPVDGGSFGGGCRGLAVTDGSLVAVSFSSSYWGTFVLLPLDGGTVRSLDSINSSGGPLAASRTAVYSFAAAGPSPDAGVHVVRTPLDGGPAEMLATLSIDGLLGSTFLDIALASDGTLYWNTFDRILYMKVE